VLGGSVAGAVGEQRKSQTLSASTGADAGRRLPQQRAVQRRTQLERVLGQWQRQCFVVTAGFSNLPGISHCLFFLLCFLFFLPFE